MGTDGRPGQVQATPEGLQHHERRTRKFHGTLHISICINKIMQLCKSYIDIYSASASDCNDLNTFAHKKKITWIKVTFISGIRCVTIL